MRFVYIIPGSQGYDGELIGPYPTYSEAAEAATGTIERSEGYHNSLKIYELREAGGVIKEPECDHCGLRNPGPEHVYNAPMLCPEQPTRTR